MRVRRLQRLDRETTEWVDDAYAYEQSIQLVRFRYNPLVWEGIGAKYNRILQKQAILLDTIEALIPPGEHQRWLDVEEIEGEPKVIKQMLDQACNIPSPHDAHATPVDILPSPVSVVPSASS